MTRSCWLVLDSYGVPWIVALTRKQARGFMDTSTRYTAVARASYEVAETLMRRAAK